MEDDVIPLLSQDDALVRQLSPEPAADQYDRSRSPFPGNPFSAPFATLVNRPFDLHIRAVPDIAGRHEMAEYPSAAVFPIRLGVPGVDQICHEERR